MTSDDILWILWFKCLGMMSHHTAVSLETRQTSGKPNQAKYLGKTHSMSPPLSSLQSSCHKFQDSFVDSADTFPNMTLPSFKLNHFCQSLQTTVRQTLMFLLVMLSEVEWSVATARMALQLTKALAAVLTSLSAIFQPIWRCLLGKFALFCLHATLLQAATMGLPIKLPHSTHSFVP